MYEEKIVENGIYGGEKEQSHSSSDKVMARVEKTVFLFF